YLNTQTVARTRAEPFNLQENPTPPTDIVRRPTQATCTVVMEPAHHLLYSLMLLIKSEHLSGYSEWVTQTAVSLTPQQLHMNELVLLGLHYAIVPFRI
ncbi:MAG: hypothetical protein GY805_23305, partial [Chloroflexi bacterium]|nr:hypothetical protein [Chloroflexota bacterium]